MARQGLQGRRPRRRQGLTRPDQGARPAPDLLGRDFSAEGVDRKWVGDFKQIHTGEGPVFLATVAVAESFFSTLQHERLSRRSYPHPSPGPPRHRRLDRPVVQPLTPLLQRRHTLTDRVRTRQRGINQPSKKGGKLSGLSRRTALPRRFPGLARECPARLRPGGGEAWRRPPLRAVRIARNSSRLTLFRGWGRFRCASACLGMWL